MVLNIFFSQIIRNNDSNLANMFSLLIQFELSVCLFYNLSRQVRSQFKERLNESSYMWILFGRKFEVISRKSSDIKSLSVCFLWNALLIDHMLAKTCPKWWFLKMRKKKRRIVLSYEHLVSWLSLLRLPIRLNISKWLNLNHFKSNSPDKKYIWNMLKGFGRLKRMNAY